MQEPSFLSTFVDLTEDDDESLLEILNPASTSRQDSAKPTPRRDVNPVILDLTGGSEEGATTKGGGMNHVGAGATSYNSPYVLSNRLQSNAAVERIQTPSVASHNGIRETVNTTHTAQSATTEDIARLHRIVRLGQERFPIPHYSPAPTAVIRKPESLDPGKNKLRHETPPIPHHDAILMPTTRQAPKPTTQPAEPLNPARTKLNQTTSPIPHHATTPIPTTRQTPKPNTRPAETLDPARMKFNHQTFPIPHYNTAPKPTARQPEPQNPARTKLNQTTSPIPHHATTPMPTTQQTPKLTTRQLERLNLERIKLDQTRFPIPHHATTPKAFTRRPEPPSVTPQKRKQSSPSDGPERPIFRTPPKVPLSYFGMARNLFSTTSQTGAGSQVQPALVQRPKTVSQSPPRISPSANSRHMPQARIFNSFSELVSSTKDEASPKPGNQSPSLETPLNKSITSNNVQKSIGRLASSQPSPEREEDVLRDLIPDQSVSPTSSSFPPDFDRGRYPQQRRRRGGLGVPNPYTIRGRPTELLEKNSPLGRGVIDLASPNVVDSRARARWDSFRTGQDRLGRGSQLQSHSSAKAREWNTPSANAIQSASQRHRRANGTFIPSGFQHIPKPPETSHFVSVNDFERGRHPPSTVNNAESSNVRIKQEPLAGEDPDSTPDYLDITSRTRGWYHDGYADVRELFQRVAMDAVLDKRKELNEWSSELDLALTKVIAKAEDFAKQKFGFFVKRLAMSTGSVPNANDIEWLQRKVSETFLEETIQATKNMQKTLPNSAQESAYIEPIPPKLHRQVQGEKRASGSANWHNRSQGLFDPERMGPRSSSRSSSSSLSDLNPIENFTQGMGPKEQARPAPTAFSQQSSQLKEKSRPSRAAAGAAASRITTQYVVYAKPSQVDMARVGKVYDRRHCADCDCLISVVNWNVHLATQKHRDNAGRKPEPRTTVQVERDHLNQDEAIREDEAVQDEGAIEIDRAIERWRSSPTDHFDKTVDTVQLQAKKKIPAGTLLVSLAASLATLERDSVRPYQGRLKRGTIDIDARMDLLSRHFLLRHVDFAADEIAMIRNTLVKNSHGAPDVGRSMDNAYASGTFTGKERQWRAIKSQVQCLEKNQLKGLPTFDLIESRVKDPNAKAACHIGSLLRHRELGSIRRNVDTQHELRSRLSEAIKPWRSFKGASHDVVTVAWAPNSLDFAAGAAAHSNSEDLQYNRPCNLLLGDLRRNTLTELPDHCIDRQKLNEGLNASQDMFNACDPKVYKTVCSVRFDPRGDQMYSASEDQTVKIWELSEQNPRCVRTINHDASVSGIDLSPVHTGVFATASQTVNNAIQVFESRGGEQPLARLSSARALMKPEWRLHPECLLWGPSAASGHLLLAGFNATGQDGEITSEGHLCLWDATTGQDLKPLPASQAIHAAAWHPRMPYFATGGASGFDKTNRPTTKTLVRVWDHRYIKRLAIEYQCPTREMQDVMFHPLDNNIVTAGCVGSISYVWDFRWPEQPLHQLRHGKSIMPSGEKDTGVMMSLWGSGNSLYYTGSSDGEIRAWDIRRHPNDVLGDTVAQLGAGIQSGAFSPDGTHLLVGDCTAGIHVLSSTPWEPRPSTSADDDIGARGAPMTIVRATNGGDGNPGTAGIDIARELVRCGEIALDPVYGPGKGPYYDGPYADNQREPKVGIMRGRLKKEIYKQQAFSRLGEERPEQALHIRKHAAMRKYELDASREKNAKILNPNLKPAEKPSSVVRGDKRRIPTPVPTAEINEPSRISSVGAANFPTERVDRTTGVSMMSDRQIGGPSQQSPTPSTVPSAFMLPKLANTSDDDSDTEKPEDEHWWPRLGEAEIARALARPTLREG